MKHASKFSESLRDGIRKLTEDQLRFLGLRLSQRLGGDIGEIAELFQSLSDVDRIVTGASTANEFFDFVDLAETVVQQEIRKRSGHEKEKSQK